MNAQATELSKQILKDHKSVSAFCRASGIDRIEWQKMSIRKEMTQEEVKRIEDALQKTSPEAQGIPPEKLELLRSKLEEAGGVREFCRSHPEFEVRHVYRAYNGQYVSGRGMAQRLVEFFEI